MNFITHLEETAQRLKQAIEASPGAAAVPTKDYGWVNHRWKSQLFRMAHLEIFNQDRFAVVHCCIFPHTYDPRPIFGFDVIAGESKVTGVFMDLSPTVNHSDPFTTLQLEKPRDRPEWGDIFSPHWIACRPNQAEMLAISDEAVAVLGRYLEQLSTHEMTPRYEDVINAQNHYCLQQRRNEHTLRAIKNLLGDDLAREFVETVLFPTV